MDVKDDALLPLSVGLKRLLDPHARRLIDCRDEPGYYDLWPKKDIEIAGRRRNDVVFLQALLKDTSWFHIRQVNAGAHDDRSRSPSRGLAALRGSRGSDALTRRGSRRTMVE